MMVWVIVTVVMVKMIVVMVISGSEDDKLQYVASVGSGKQHQQAAKVLLTT